MDQKHEIGHFVLRVSVALLFIIPGLSKLMDPSMIAGLLGQIGFPLPLLFAWIVLLSEILFGVALLIGWKTEYTAWPLLIILVVAFLTVTVPAVDMSNVGSIMSVLWHILGVGALVSIIMTGPGKYAV